MSKSLVNHKPKPPQEGSEFPWKWIAIAVGLSTVAFLTSVVAFSLFLNIANRAVAGTAAAGTQLATTFGQVVMDGIEHTLVEGADENRLVVLNELAKTDFSHSPAPPQLYAAAKTNLQHENETIRVAAEKAVAAMEKSSNLGTSDE